MEVGLYKCQGSKIGMWRLHRDTRTHTKRLPGFNLEIPKKQFWTVITKAATNAIGAELPSPRNPSPCRIGRPLQRPSISDVVNCRARRIGNFSENGMMNLDMTGCLVAPHKPSSNGTTKQSRDTGDSAGNSWRPRCVRLAPGSQASDHQMPMLRRVGKVQETLHFNWGILSKTVGHRVPVVGFLLVSFIK